ncbi:MAG: sn-glycerol-3-phosphate ABC transporter ATP-binding protein UgpC [Acidimicrobiia bacterium]|nr:sn-glycerol-3-phosphate ABC transporter ATP-binding protein UgpC [Acidimicrobiia bacterium]MBT8216011.1 sn-glycerol-3-phosphate ABC transporter ATP-binding protein UgpC [Acidimicrobiia bacterium]NNF10746.1 sn-glycerol-3-phosphate ABC transporter ATP-binding protein UgpC [Acidimicrobiia bacterium]NNL69225.1 sn-glycerol-3-phosphate ABC transporter ATP-binding protein UgpC [Acidimicrobiia bacterium]
MATIGFEDVGKIYPGGTRAIEGVNFEIADGEFLVVVGPSGCGKSTLLRMVAGLEEISEGKIIIGDRVVNDVQPKDRDIAMVFQNYALYPHMSVFDNMAFGLKLRKMSKDEIKSRVDEAARVLEITEYLDRKPKALSGGQRQRVAMGRAIVREPAAFLMDEPLSNLDAKLRVQMRTELGRLHTRLNTTTMYVTHDQVEAMTLGHRVAVMRKGLLQQVDSPFNLFQAPDNLFVAGFIGSPAMNFLYVTLESDGAGGMAASFGGEKLNLGSQLLSENKSIANYAGKEVVMGVRPAAFEDSRITSDIAGHSLEVELQVVEVLGSETFAHFDIPVRPVVTPDIEELLADSGADPSTLGDSTRITARISSDVMVRAGERITLVVDNNKLHFFDPATNLRIF